MIVPETPNIFGEVGDYTDVKTLTGTTSTWKPCKHKGYYFTVKFWIFKKELFWCDRCKKCLNAKLIRELTPNS